ncbi:MAG: periplasmic heavy metal sensor [Halomonadaceae bacterium]|nr:periplasmic heavy metal sensor [Halomonadaceae bacterium]
MQLSKLLATITLTLGIVGTATAQQMSPPSQGDQMEQLEQLLDLEESQQQEIRSLMETAERELAPKEQEAQALQANLAEQVGPDVDENAVRQDATRLGELTGEITAESILLQSRIEVVFTDDQRQRLDDAIAQQQQQMQDLQNQLQQQGQPAQ